MKKILLLILYLMGSLYGHAQYDKGKEKIRAYKVAFLTEKLNLSAKEAQKFWPLYNEFDQQRRFLLVNERQQIKQNIKASEGTYKLTDQEAEVILNKLYALKKEHYTLSYNFKNKLSNFLSFKQILALEIAEHEFNKKLMRRLRERRNPR